MSAETLSPARAEPTVVSPPIAYSQLTPAPQHSEPLVEPTPVSPLVANAADTEVKGEAPVPRPFACKYGRHSKNSEYPQRRTHH